MGTKTATKPEVKTPEIKKQLGPVVLAVFRADVKATAGRGSTVALIQGASGKCRLYGKNALANAFPDIAELCLTLTSAFKIGKPFAVPVLIGKAAWAGFMADKKLVFAGQEKVLGDVGSGSPGSGFRTVNYQAF